MVFGKWAVGSVLIARMVIASQLLKEIGVPKKKRNKKTSLLDLQMIREFEEGDIFFPIVPQTHT